MRCSRFSFGTPILAASLLLQQAGFATAQSGEQVSGDRGLSASASSDRASSDRASSDRASSKGVQAGEGVSQVRIVRLSQARGAVQLDRNTGRGYEMAFANIPIVQGARLRTGDGVAEVEFEDNSTLRLAPNSEVSFPELSRTAAGATLTNVRVSQGIAYASLAKTKSDRYTLTEGRTTIQLAPASHVRLEARGAGQTDRTSQIDQTDSAKTVHARSELAVFEGEARVAAPSGPEMTVPKKKTLVFDPTEGRSAEQIAAERPETAPLAARGTARQEGAGEEAATLTHRVDVETYDEWDRTQQQYHQQRATLAGVSGGGVGLYGANDLNYYGQFADMPGCGSMWRPYFASAAWDPFANGIWAMYPTAGYSWVSPYPWGWLPFHSGSWQQCGAGGWGWRPGGQWYGLTNHTLLTGVRRPVVTSTGLAGTTLVPVNAKPLTLSGVSAPGTFTFRKDSAGLGVPRESFGRLSGTSSSVARHGEVRSSLEAAAAGSAGYAPSRVSSAASPVSVSAARPGLASGPSVASGPVGRGASAGGSSAGAGAAGGGGHR